jgi:RNA polymerase sigma factor (TIGR02999 family)
MSEVSQILHAIAGGDPSAASQLLPLVYDELRQLAAQKLAREAPGQTLQPSDLVHEAYLRLVGDQTFEGRGHFFAAAAEAMRRILVENARRKQAVKHGGDLQRVEMESREVPVRPPPEEIVALDDALTRLTAEDPEAAQIVQLHFFAGLTIEQAAEALGVSRATAYRQWSFARAWLRCAIGGEYVDALVLRDRSTHNNGTLDERLWVQQDANWNVTALFNSSGSVVERYVYDPYGQVTYLNGTWSTISGSAYAWMYGLQGLRLDTTTGNDDARERVYRPTVQRFLQVGGR